MAIRDLDRRLGRLEAAVPSPHRASEAPAEALEAIDVQMAAMLRDLPDPDSPTWRAQHYVVLTEAAALHRGRWAPSAGGQPGHDLMADPGTVVQVTRILRQVGVA